VNGLPLAVLVVGGGASSRFGSDKLSRPLGGRTVLERAVAAVTAPLPGAAVVLAVRAEHVAELSRRWAPLGVRVVAGGLRRQDSVRRAFEALDPADDTLVVIHDGARPLVSGDDVRAVVAAAAQCGAAVLTASLVDTIKRIDASGLIIGTLPREELGRALTPQVFRAGLLRRAWAQVGDGSWTDEAGLLEIAGFPVRAVPGDPGNTKITRREDLGMLAGAFAPRYRTGFGIDVHPFDPERPLWLCGVRLDGEAGLSGHSDSDVALHAITDAILGACGAGDIGLHFPPSDPQWRGAPSDQFVVRALELAGEAGWRVVHCDLTLLAEVPRINPHRDRLRGRLAELLDLDLGDIGLKATTTEGLGFVGRREGMTAMALVTLERC